MPGAAGKGRRLNEGAQPMKPNAIVSREEWLAARKRLLSKEKEFTRLRDDLSRERRELPWIEVEKKLRLRYPRRQAGFVRSLPGPRPARRLSLHVRSGLGAGVQELLVLGRQFQRHHRPSQSPGREPGAVSRAPLEKLEAFRKRMGWTFKWVSSFGNEFNSDYRVSFTPEELSKGEVYYNYGLTEFPSDEAPGISVFYKDAEARIFHTYSCYARGLDMMNVAYHYLDLVPKGRDEEQLRFTMEWVRHHDRYED